MEQAEALVVPSICYENFPMVIVEAFANSLPVIGSSLGGIPEILEDGYTGRFLTPGSHESLVDALDAWQENGEAGSGMGQCAFEVFRNRYSADVAYKQLLALYNFG